MVTQLLGYHFQFTITIFNFLGARLVGLQILFWRLQAGRVSLNLDENYPENIGWGKFASPWYLGVPLRRRYESI